MPDDLGSFQQGEERPVERPTEQWAQKRLRQASEWTKTTLRAARGLASALGPWGCAILAGLVILLAAAVIGFAVFGGDLRQGSSAHQEATDNDLIKKVLAYAGDTEVIRLDIVEGGPKMNQLLDEVNNKLNNLTDSKKNQAETQALIKKIEETKSLANQAGGNPTAETINKIGQNMKEIGQKAQVIITPTGADFDHLKDREIAKIKVVKSNQDKSQRRIYFLDKDGKTLGSAPINIGQNLKTKGFKRGDEATPSGTYTIGAKTDGGQNLLYSSGIGKNAVLGYQKIQINIPGRAIVIHGSTPKKNNKLYPTWGCVRMYNSHLAYVFPLIKTGIPIEIVE